MYIYIYIYCIYIYHISYNVYYILYAKLGKLTGPLKTDMRNLNALH